MANNDGGKQYLPLPWEELRIIQGLLVQDHDQDRCRKTTFLISTRWWKTWKGYVDQEIGNLDRVNIQFPRPGRIDNSDLIAVDNGPLVDDQSDFIELRPHLHREDYECVNEKAWNQLFEWYEGGPALPRMKIMTTDHTSSLIDLYPLLLIVQHKEVNTSITISTWATLSELYDMVIAHLNLEEERDNVQIWDSFGLDKPKNPLPPSALDRVVEAGIVHKQDILVEIAFDTDQVDPTAEISTPGGSKGLMNLGNTCFMNSALQCLFHIPHLVEYFSKDYRREINVANPFGKKGKLASAFGELLRKAWSPGEPAITPRRFHWRIVTLPNDFHPSQQHDSQEFLAYLLDCLNEDLNRIKAKPYDSEQPSVDGRPDEEVAADKHWADHKARNDSVIADTFHGQYKSKLVCSFCQRESVSCEPFVYLSLPIPSTTMRITVTVIYADGRARPSVHTVAVPRHGSCKDLTQAMSIECGLEGTESLIIAHVSRDKKKYQYLSCRENFLPNINGEDYVVAFRFPELINNVPLLQILRRKKTHDRHKSGWTKFDDEDVPMYEDFGIPLLTYLPKNLVGLRDINKAAAAVLAPFREVRRIQINSSGESGNSEDEDGGSIKDDDLMDEEDDLIMWSAPVQDRVYFFRSGSLQTHLMEWTEKEEATYDTTGVDSRLPNVSNSLFPSPFGPREDELEDESVSLLSCLDAFLKVEPLDDMWFCPACKEWRQATKKLDLWRLPNVFVFHLKRFCHKRRERRKLDTNIHFPLRGLDLGKYMKDKTTSHVYNLSAICDHYGNLNDGHYKARAELPDGTWAVFDDEKVSRVSFGDSISCPFAYLLFYQRVEGDVKDQDQVNTTSEDGGVVADLHDGEENGEPSQIASDDSILSCPGAGPKLKDE